MADAGSPSPDPPPPLLQFHSLSAHSTRPVAQYWFCAPSPSFPAADTSKDAPSRTRRLVCHGPRGLPHHVSHARPKARAVHSQSYARFRVWPPHHSHVVTFPRRSSTYGPPRVSSPTALSDGCVHDRFVSACAVTPTATFIAAGPGLPHPVRSAFRASHPPDGLLRIHPCRLVSSDSRPWGSSLQSLLTKSRNASRRPLPS